MQDYYVDKQYIESLPNNAIKDLNTFFFRSFLKDCKKILDIGCSTGRIMGIIGKGRVEGVDIDGAALKLAKSGGFKVKYGDLAKSLNYKNETFEAIFCSQVIEHMGNPLGVMLEIKRILKKDGKLVIITPDYKIASKSNKNNFWEDYTHKRPFVRETLERLSYDAGFSKYRVYHFPGKGWRNLIRIGILSKEQWIRIEKLPFVWKGQDLILEAIK